MGDRLDLARQAFKGWREAQIRELEERGRRPSLFDDPAPTWEEPASASIEWMTAALAIVRGVAETHETFTVIDFAGILPQTYDRRAIGAVMVKAKRLGWIESLGYVAGDRARHQRPVVEWRSRIFKEAA